MSGKYNTYWIQGEEITANKREIHCVDFEVATEAQKHGKCMFNSVLLCLCGK